MDDNQFTEIKQKVGNQISPGHLDSLQNVDAKVGHQFHKRTGTLNEINTEHDSIRKKRRGRKIYVIRS